MAFRLLTIATLSAAAGIAAATGASAAVIARPLEVLLWVALASAAGLLHVPVLPRARIEVTLSAPVHVAAAVVLGPQLALLVAAMAVFSPMEFQRGVTNWSRAFNRAQTGLSAWLAALAASLAAGLPHAWPLLIGAAIAGAVFHLCNGLFIGVAAAALGRLPLAAALRDSAEPMPRFTTSFGGVTLLGALLALTYQSVGFLAPVLLALPIWMGYRLLKELRASQDRVRDLEVLNRLGHQLAKARLAEYVCQVAETVLSEELGVAVACSLDGAVADGCLTVPVPDNSPAVLAVPPHAREYEPLLKAAAAALGEVLRRLEAEHETERTLLKQSGLADRIVAENIARRMAVAHDLEDDALQHLAAGLMQLESVRAAADRQRLDLVQEYADASRGTFDDAFRKGKAAIDQLRDATNLSEEVYDLDVGDMLTRVIDDLKAAGLACTMELGDPPAKLPPLMTVAAAQVAKSCLEAAAQAGVRRAHLQLGVNGHLILEVRSDPGGFSQPPRAMLNRVHLAGGRVTIDHEERGDVLRAVIPLVGYKRPAIA